MNKVVDIGEAMERKMWLAECEKEGYHPELGVEALLEEQFPNKKRKVEG